MPVLFIFGGLPGVGKTTLARGLARRTDAVYLRIDTIEQGLRDLCQVQVEGQGYRLAYRIATDNLRAGNHVIADSCNPIELTRCEWEAVAKGANATWVNVEIICSDAAEHRHRIEFREPEIKGLVLPTWQEVEKREYHEWTRDRLVVDTAGKSEKECLEILLSEARKLQADSLNR